MKLNGKFRFPVAEGVLKQPEAKTVFRNSTVKDPKSKVVEGKPSDLGEPTFDFWDFEEDAETGSAEPVPAPSTEPDHWYMVGDALVRKHNIPRTKLFVPDPMDCPIPLKYLDIFRFTNTDLNSFGEHSITDFRTNGETELSDTWVGTTKFHILRPDPGEGWQWVEGRRTKIPKSTRPPNIWPEVWQTMSKKAKRNARRDWDIEKPKREEARRLAGIGEHVADEDIDDYTSILATKRRELEPAPVPEMACI